MASPDILGLAALVGGGSAPWVAAVLAGRLMTLRQHEARTADLKAAHARDLEQRDKEATRLIAERDYERQAKDVERNRADANADQLHEVVAEFGQTTVSFLRALPEAADA